MVQRRCLGHTLPGVAALDTADGAVVFVVGWVGGTVGGIMVMGDPGPGQVKTEPGWLVAASFATTALILPR